MTIQILKFLITIFQTWKCLNYDNSKFSILNYNKFKRNVSNYQWRKFHAPTIFKFNILVIVLIM